ncbi:MAG TPA: MFS transporter [Burkholderiales bacterium]|nr:MFS transporter [Burkholderiales bacterium]
MKKNNSEASLATKPFLLLSISMFLGYASQWVLTPVIPLYVADLGGSTFIAGLALLAFAIPSFVFRPLVGRIADRWSAAGVLAVGLGLLAAGTLVCVVPLLAMMFVGMIVRGLGWAGVNTGGYTTLATAAPANRRGEAAGYYSSVTTSANIVFPGLGLWLMTGPGGFQTVCVVSTLLGLLGLPVAWNLARRQSRTKAPAAPGGEPEHARLLERGVLLATGLNLCSSLAAPSVMAFLPLYARSLGIANIGWFYVLAGVTSIVIRPLLGRKSDSIGRGPAILIGLAAQLIGLSLIIVAQGIVVILVGGFFVALGMAMIGSTTTALAMDLANPRSRGRSMATFSISFQIGAGTGAIISGALADLVGLRGMYAGSIVITLVGFGLLASAWKSLPRPHKAG